jgi:hypothetical protein
MLVGPFVAKLCRVPVLRMSSEGSQSLDIHEAKNNSKENALYQSQPHSTANSTTKGIYGALDHLHDSTRDKRIVMISNIG